MLSFVKKAMAATLLAAFTVLPLPAFAQADGQVAQQTGAACHGEMFNPITHTDWNNMYPITIMGVSMGAGVNPPLMYEPPVCVCPGPFGIPSYGIGITFWEPLYISEIERTPGCMASLGGVSILSGYSTLQSEQVNESKDGGPVSRMQVHWYEYPIIAMLDMMKSYGCFSTSGFDLMYLTEIDPTWQSDEWAAVFAPEAALFTSTLAQASCSIDAVASSAGMTLDAMFWCAGTWGGVYPLAGNPGHTNSNFTSNNLVQSKFLARQSRVGLQWQTIGPTALCFSHPNPIWLKSQYRVNQVGPLARKGSPVVIGDPGLRQFPTISNMPTRESTVNLIWQGQQCCARLY
jgi:conjugal transfer pilus assembly protein TraU